MSAARSRTNPKSEFAGLPTSSDEDPLAWFNRTAAEIRFLLGGAPARSGFVGIFIKFGLFGSQLTVDREHLKFLRDLTNFLHPEPPIFDSQVIKKWNGINHALIGAFGPLPASKADFRDQSVAMATMAAFPLLEDVARRVTGGWTADGFLIKDIGPEFGLTRGKPSEVRAASYRAGQRISLLEHKLRLMHIALRDDVRGTLESLSKAIARSAPASLTGNSLYERLSGIRNDWLHGSRAEGWEGLLVSLLLALIYFPTAADPDMITCAEWKSKIAPPTA